MKRSIITFLLFCLIMCCAYSNEPVTGVFSPENKTIDINAIDIRDGLFFVLYSNRVYYRLSYQYEIQNSIITVNTIDGILLFQIVDSKTLLCISEKFNNEIFIKKE